MAEDVKRQNDIKKLAEMMKDIRMAMLTTVEASGELRSRPMATQEVEFDGDLWFFTKEHSPKVGEVEADQQVSVTFSNPSDQRYVAVSGRAQVVRDHAKLAQLWRPILKAWFPDGLEDPELALLKVEVRAAEYWDAPASKAVQLFGMVKAGLSGKAYEPGDHEKLDLEKGYVS